jgi:hypothetical protein
MASAPGSSSSSSYANVAGVRIPLHFGENLGGGGVGRRAEKSGDFGLRDEAVGVVVEPREQRRDAHGFGLGQLKIGRTEIVRRLRDGELK